MSGLTYAGVGHRAISHADAEVITGVARRLRALGWACRTGDADGSDEAFLRGASPEAEVLLPEHHAGRAEVKAPRLVGGHPLVSSG